MPHITPKPARILRFLLSFMDLNASFIELIITKNTLKL
ncbi:hypothetical protein FEM08_33690 [Flavobacterium gilvum]|nr:hypothetical protein FEM08_33690 [Flavobacterium gilvum]